MQKKNIGSVFALYPMPCGVIGTMHNGKPNWMLCGHVGIITHKLLSVSLHQSHVTTTTAMAGKRLSFNFVNDAMAQRASYVGIASAKAADKSGIFPYQLGETGMPVISEADCAMELEVIDDYQAEDFHNLVCRVVATHVNPAMHDDKGKIDYGKFKPYLFEMPTYKFLRTGEVIGSCLDGGMALKAQLAAGN